MNKSFAISFVKSSGEAYSLRYDSTNYEAYWAQNDTVEKNNKSGIDTSEITDIKNTIGRVESLYESLKTELAVTKELIMNVQNYAMQTNQKLMDILGRRTPMEEAFAKADDILKGAVQGISDIIMKPGYINVDFADVKTVMSEQGIAMMGTGQSSIEERGIDAANQAVSSELLEDVELKDARGILVNITAKSPTMADFDEVDSVIREFTAEDATIIYGTVMEDSMDEDELLVTVVATGVNQKTATLAVDNTRRATVQLNPVGLNDNQAISPVESGGTSSAEDIDFLDVPTFMRKQVD